MPRNLNTWGLINPKARAPVKMLSINSKKRRGNQKIQLSKLIPLENPRILVKRRLGGIGDVLMTTPLCAAIKRLVPHCTLIYATDVEYANGSLKEVINHCPYVDQLVSNNDVPFLKNIDYMVDVTTTGLKRENPGTIPPNRIDMFAEEAGISVEDDPVPVYSVRQEERDKITQELKGYFGKNNKRKDIKLIAVQVRSNDARRTWPLEYMQELLDQLSEHENFRILTLDWGKTVDKWIAKKNQIPILDRSIADTAAILEQCDLIICPDSSMLHLAGALGKKILSIFGPIPPQSRVNHYVNTTALVGPCLSHPCWYRPICMKKSNMAITPKLSCLTELKPEEVYNASIKKLEEEEKITTNIRYGKDYSIANQDDIILVKRTSRGIGDILMALNGIEALKTKYPRKKIHLAVPKGLHEILKYNPKIDRIIDCNDKINPRRYFLIADISSPCARYEAGRVSRGQDVQKTRVEIFSEALGTSHLIPDLLPKYYISEEEGKIAKNFFDKKITNNKPSLFFAPEAAERYRTYPEEYWQPLINKLSPYFNILLALSRKSGSFSNCIDISYKSFRNKMALLGACDGCITTDSAPLHVAAALNIPIIAIFGPIDAKARCRGYKQTTVIKSDLDCIPCWRNGTMKCKKKPGEPTQTYSKCLEELAPNKVANIVKKKFLEEKK